jgi:hypothetical protein
MSEVENMLRQRIKYERYQAFHRKCSLTSICKMPRIIAPWTYGTQSPCRPRASMLMTPRIRSLKAKDAYVVHRLAHPHQIITNTISHRCKHNAQESPLLRMPAEIRRIIYEYALGRNDLHIFRHPNQPSMTKTRLSCKVCVSPCDCAEQLTAYGANLTGAHHSHHHVCYSNVFGYGLDLSLLRSCSQIYMEASLLLFAHNNLVFAETELLPLFTRKLALMQAAAIKSLNLDNITVFDLFDDSYWSPFPGLRYLAVAVRGHDRCVDNNSFWSSNCRELNHIVLTNFHQQWQEEPAYAPLGRLNLETFQFHVTCVSGYHRRGCRTLGEWQQWAKTIEREVSTRWTKQEARRRQAQTRLLQAADWPTGPIFGTWSLRETAWDVVHWLVLRLPFWKDFLLRKLWP